MKTKKINIILLMVLLLTGCHKMRHPSGWLKQGAFQHLSIGMNKQQVIDAISDPDLVRSSVLDKEGNAIEVWEYIVLRGSGWDPSLIEKYWLYFHNDKLVRWGTDEIKNIHEVRFR